MSKTRYCFEQVLGETLAKWDVRADEHLDLPPETADKIKKLFRTECGKIVQALADEMELWTKRCDDAKRIPDVIAEKAITISRCPVTTP